MMSISAVKMSSNLNPKELANFLKKKDSKLLVRHFWCFLVSYKKRWNHSHFPSEKGVVPLAVLVAFVLYFGIASKFYHE